MERQQAQRKHGQAVAPSDSGYSGQSGATEHHSELDVLDTLDLGELSGQVRLRSLLLDDSGDADVTLGQLSKVIGERLLEGNGETLFDLGQEDNGESMNFSKEQWDIALDRIRRASQELRAECRILLTRNVGNAEEAEVKNEKVTACEGKILIRQDPETTEGVIELRIAVVGNGRHRILLPKPQD